MSLLELLCHVDDFCQAFTPKWQQLLLGQGLCQRRQGKLKFKRADDHHHSLSPVRLSHLQGLLPASVDATALAVCRNQRIHQHKVFARIAARGKTTMGWFYGFKLHVVANDQGELLACQIIPSNVDDVPGTTAL